MCGIVCVFELKQDSELLRPQILDMVKKVRHRGPDCPLCSIRSLQYCSGVGMGSILQRKL
ncbi:MAG TPA: hypothetical protein ENO01_02335 [Candidatus Marinimicrobia bacterium]|nr:hypothetical protein [Candidatus Neomarinimicrobiota bacterium]